MRRILTRTMSAALILLILTACAQQGTALPTRAALAEIQATVVQPDTNTEEVPAAQLAEPTTLPLTEEIVNGERPLLPNVATAPVESGLGGGAGANITIAENTNPAETSALSPQAANLFTETTFNLNATLPADTAEAQVWQQPAVALDINRANKVAQRWGFNGPLYQFATPDESILDEPVGPEAAQLPANLPEFHVFDGARSLVITEDAAYFSDASVPFDYETPQPFDQRAPAAEAVLQSMGLLDFPYKLADGWGHEVWVTRILDGMAADYPEISAGINENGRLAFASYQPFDQMTAVGTYPLISAETAWKQIQDGIDENVLFSIIPGTEADPAPPPPAGFQYWPREYQSGQEAHFYTFPTIYLPVDEGFPPRVHALNYTVQADDDTLRALAEQLGRNVHFWGTLDTINNSLALTGWEPVLELNPLIKNGTIQRQGEQTLLIDQEGGMFILPNAPADLANGSQVNVFSWAARDAGQAYQVLDWEGIDMQVPGVSGESIAMPEVLLPTAPDYQTISINDVALAYTVYPELVVRENGRYQQSYWLIPVWQFIGSANNGDTITFTVQAAKQ